MRSSPWAVIVGVVLVSSCTSPRDVRVAPRPSAALRATAKTVAPKPVRPPPPRITTPMAGEPTGAALAAARLVPGSCEVAPEVMDERIKEMHNHVNYQFESWHAGQPGCWEMYRAIGTLPPGTGWGSGMGMGGGPRVRMGAASVGGDDSGPRMARRASGTNNQVAGVDEGDIVKTDGKYVYLVANGALRIVEALEPRLVSITKVPGSVRELFIEGERAIVYSSSNPQPRPCTYGYDCRFAGDGSSTTITVFDIADKTQPKLVRTMKLSGSLMASRRIGNGVHTVVADGDSPRALYETWPRDLAMCGTPESVVKSKFAALKRVNEKKLRAMKTVPTLTEGGVEKQLCEGLLRTAIPDGHAFTTIVSFDLTSDAPATTATIESRPGAVFAGADALYLSVVHKKNAAHDLYSADETSEVHKFRVGEDPSTTSYVGSGVVPGHVLNQFAMDEWYGYLRIATTSGQVPSSKVESAVSVLAEGEGGNLVRVGAVAKIAPGEDIRAVRFDDDRGYVVTFKKTDPLFVIDLQNPAEPTILGELKIPGFSTYIHRIDDDHLLSIGFDANDHGSFAYFDGVILQLFDVTNPTDPKLIHKEKIGTRGSSSEAATNHLAFNYFADTGHLAFPMTICEGGADGVNGNDLAFSGLLVYDVDIEKGFKRLGGIDHGSPGADCNTWWSNATSAVKRSLFLDDLVYSIATDRLKVQRLGHFGEDIADIELAP